MSTTKAQRATEKRTKARALIAEAKRIGLVVSGKRGQLKLSGITPEALAHLAAELIERQGWCVDELERAEA